MLSSCQYYNLRSKIASQKADLLYAKHDFDEALRYYQLASRLNPKDTKYLKLAKCYQQIEDKNAEIDNLQKAFANEELTLADK